MTALAEAYARDGVVHIPGALDGAALAEAESAYSWSLTHPRSSMPRLPDIEADRGAWDIVSWAVEPGDLIVFHPRLLHGGAPTRPGKRRRTLTLRFFGEDAVYEPREGGAGPRAPGFHERMTAGAPFRDPSFLKLRG